MIQKDNSVLSEKHQSTALNRTNFFFFYTMATDKIPEKNAIGDIIKFYRPIHTISKMFGYLPFTIESTNGEIKSKIYLIDWLWFISYILFSVFCLGNYLVQLDKVLLNTTSSQVVHFGVPLVTILGFFKMMLSFTLDMINRHRVAQNLQTIREIDEKVREKRFLLQIFQTLKQKFLPSFNP